jgi:DUF4097 and DUF4098 domain-containing protein YvlB
MKKKLSLSLLAVLAAALIVLPAIASDRTISTSDAFQKSAEGDCDAAVNVRFDDRPVYRAEEQRTIAGNSFSKLSIHPPRNGGVQVEGWDRSEVSVKVCKAAADDSEQAARGKLDRIKLSINGGNVTAEGPDGDHWSVHFLVRVPNNINLELEAQNGPISLRNVNGTVDARTVNGPVAVKKCSGTIVAEARNGPVSLSESSGKIRVSAQNGPVSVRLADQQWTGEGLDASTHNGPLELRIPSRYQSGVEVVSDGHSPFRCDSDVCGEANRTWDNDGAKKARFGAAGAPVVVRMSTVNGPVSVRGTME